MSKRENKTVSQSVRLVFSDFQVLKERNPKNVSYEIRKAIKLYLSSVNFCLLYTSPSPRDRTRSRMPSSA